MLSESRRNMHRMSREVTQTNTQALSHFVSNSLWLDVPLLSTIAHQAVDLMRETRHPSVETDAPDFLSIDKDIRLHRQHHGG